MRRSAMPSVCCRRSRSDAQVLVAAVAAAGHRHACRPAPPADRRAAGLWRAAIGRVRDRLAGIVLLIALGILSGFAIGYGAAMLLSAMFSGESGIVLPVGFVRDDLKSVVAIVLFSAILALAPALLAYRQSPAAALRA